MVVELGQVALLLAFLSTAYVVVASVLGVARRTPELVVSGRYGFYSVPVLLLLATAALVYAFVTNDFSVRYVAENSNLAMPGAYTWVAFYAGNAGSLLFLAVVFSLLAAAAVISVRKRLPYTAPYATGILSMVLLFFLTIILFFANPLSQLQMVPQDGQGMNPLLVHFGMFIHPPLQMTGLVIVALPFSIALGALLAGRGGDDDWVDLGRAWGMVAWVVLTIGLLLGAWWAYTILGWGGYWAWDPVENSALMPWLAMTAFVHSIMVQKRRGMFRMWNMVLIIVAFTLAQMGMFINRGGPVPSVHSFAQSSMGWLFLAFMVATLFGSIAIFILKSDTLKSRGKLQSMLSRESAFLAQNVAFLVVAFVTLWGTVFPIFSEAANNVTITVGQPFFNKINGPLLLFIVFLMGVGPLLPWRRASAANLVRALCYPLGVAGLAGIVLLATGIRQPAALVGLMVCAMVITGILNEWARGTRSRQQKGENYLTAFVRLLSANRPRYGGYIVHLAIVMLTVGAIASSFYSVQRDFAMNPGETRTLGEYTFTYTGIEHTDYPDREEDIFLFLVASGNSSLGIMRPFRATYPSFRITATRGAIHSTPIEDFYIVPSEFAEGGQAVFRVLINPMVWWMWASGPILVLGMIVALSPQRQPSPLSLRFPVGARVTKA
ncbi:heme lyase CcmF/NrfE family subunit [Dehalococcoidia bacterium]|nr:heme lyase CcmF/NrfE family subunit [Dehalococcoidia bacterium]